LRISYIYKNNIKMRKASSKIILIILLSLVLLSFKSYNNKCTATWYDMHGKFSASGVKMNRNKPTAAYNSLPLGTKILVTNIANNKEVIVTITDRMGRRAGNRIDLSLKAFDKISSRTKGRINVKIRTIT
jgi:rare lipoprotein A